MRGLVDLESLSKFYPLILQFPADSKEWIMRLFRRVLRWVFFLFGLLVGMITAVAAFFAQRMIKPPRQRLWATPGDLGLAYKDIHFPAQDGIRLSGWFIPVADTRRDGATVVLVHGWPWNRLG